MSHFFNVKDFDAVRDGITKTTAALQEAIEACAASGGGTVVIPAGRYLTGPIYLRSHVNLHLESGATLLFSEDPADYPTVFTRWSGIECQAYSPCVYGHGLVNVSLTGRGTLDGQGAAWWRRYRALYRNEDVPNAREIEFKGLNLKLSEEEFSLRDWHLQYLRPPLVQLIDCRDVLLQGVTCQNSPFWNTHLVYCDRVTVDGVTILNPSDTPNGDGLDIDSCSNVHVSNCHFDVGDDCLCLKAGMDRDGRRVNRPTENVTITNCTMRHGHGGVVLGSDIAGGIRNVCVSNCIFVGTTRGIRIKANRGRGGFVEDVLVSNVLMKGTRCPFVINSFYVCGHSPGDKELFGEEPRPVTEKTPVFRRITIQNLSARDVTGGAVYVSGLPERPIEDLVFDNVEIATIQDMGVEPSNVDMMPPGGSHRALRAGDGFFGRFLRGLRLRSVRIHPRQGPALQLEEAAGISISDFETNLQIPVEEAMVFQKVTDLRVH